MINYLTEEEQYRHDINNEEIARIKDDKLRNIRMKYWNLRHEALLNQSGIPDWELEKVLDTLDLEEQKELIQYRQSIGIAKNSKH